MSVMATSDIIFDKDAKALTRLIPSEIWVEVLRKVDHKDKYPVNNASLYFRHILSSAQTSFLFPQVWNILALRTLQPSSGYDNSNTSKPPSIIFDLRMTCKTWSAGIDAFFQNLNFYLLSMKNDADSRELSVYSNDDKVEDLYISKRNVNIDWTSNSFLANPWSGQIPDLDKFLAHFEMSHLDSDRNPFIGRRLRIGLGCYCFGNTSISCFNCSKILPFLELYGKHIWYFEIYPHWNQDRNIFRSQIPYVSAIRKCLEHLPNLRHLTWKYDKKLRFKAVSDVPFPKLPKLRQVVLVNVPPSIAGMLFAQNPQISQCHPEYHAWTSKEHLLNLSHLSKEIYDEHCLQSFASKSRHLQLEKLELIFTSGFIVWSKIFRVLELFKPSLINLVIHLPFPTTVEDARALGMAKDLQLDLPNLKRLRVKTGLVHLIKFFRPLGNSLELLEIDMGVGKKSFWGKEFDDSTSQYEQEFRWKLNTFIRSEIVKDGVLSGDYDYSLYDTNIWELFPRLRRIDCYAGKTNPAEVYHRRNVII